MKRLKASGFTILELLLVIALIAVLAILASFAITGVRKTGLTVKNINNLKQLAVGYHAYAADHNGVMPPNMQNIKGGVGRMSTTGIDLWPHAGPRRLFDSEKWAFGTGSTDYLGSPDVFYGPFTPKVNSMRASGELWENVPTSYRIGYVYIVSYPEDDSDKRTGGKKRFAPTDKSGRLVTNDRSNGHPRAPLFTDIYSESWAEMTGFPLSTQAKLNVVHLDGSISSVDREASAKAKDRVLFMAGLE